MSAEKSTRNRFSGRETVFPMLRYTIYMKRRSTFFINTLIVPCSLLTALNVLSVFLPVESGEKIGLGMTLMLAQVVNLLILSSILPASSLHFPKLGKYFLVTIGLIGMSLVYNCAITNYFHNDFTSIYRRIIKRKDSSRSAKTDAQTNIDIPIEIIEMNDLEIRETIERRPDDFNKESQKQTRRDLCAICDFTFGVIMLCLVLIVHIIYFAMN
ncbi:neuronal acetylcholine receptor subunit alpha-7-like [Symsagittifera roscoffensis]